MTRILLIGKNGQVGYELARSLQSLGEVVALDRSQMDLADFDRIRQVIRDLAPDLIVNPAAYTAVDKAETEKDLAFRINGNSVGALAAACRVTGTRLLQISTDYVFDGNSTAPLKESDPVGPVNIYGASKLRGEELAMQEHPDACPSGSRRRLSARRLASRLCPLSNVE